MKETEIKLLIFDMDGVVLDSEPLHEIARQDMFRHMGIIPAEDFPNPVGANASGFWKAVLERCGMTGDPDALMLEQFRRVEDLIREDHLGPCDGLPEVLEWAKARKMKIGLASSTTQPMVGHALELIGVREYFDYVISGDQVSRRKPDPEIYLKVLHLAGIPAAEAAAVEDSAAGIAAARAAGIFCFGYDNPTSGPQDHTGSSRIIRDLREIMEFR